MSNLSKHVPLHLFQSRFTCLTLHEFHVECRSEMLRHTKEHMNLKKSYSNDENTRCKLTNSLKQSTRLSLSRIASFYSTTIVWISVHQLRCLPVFPGPNELPSCKLAMEKQRAPTRATQIEVDRKERKKQFWNWKKSFERNLHVQMWSIDSTEHLAQPWLQAVRKQPEWT